MDFYINEGRVKTVMEGGKERRTKEMLEIVIGWQAGERGRKKRPILFSVGRLYGIWRVSL